MKKLSGKSGKWKVESGQSFSLIPHPSSLIPFFLCLFVSALLSFATAQSSQDAINLASAHPAFAKGLEVRPGWTAVAYDTQNRYGVWHVEFYDAEGNGIGWADVNVGQGKVYAWDAAFDIIEGQYAEAEQALLDFLRQDETFNTIGGSPDDNWGTWVGYDSWREVWMVHIERGADSLDVTVRSRSSTPKSFESLYLEKVYVANIMSYDDWQNASGSEAVAIAFEQPEIASAVREVEGWTTQTEQIDGNAWKVRFMSGEQVLVEADVNVAENNVTSFNIM